MSEVRLSLLFFVRNQPHGIEQTIGSLKFDDAPVYDDAARND